MNVFKTIEFNEPNKEQDRISGGISGAITNPDSDEAINHAELYYEEIRKMSTDVRKISKNTGFEFDAILMIKHYLFIDEHNLNGKIKRFEPSFEIAESWRRLAFDKKNIKPHDIILLKHELKEMSLISQGIPQNQAHIITSKEYNYAKKSRDFYKTLHQEIKHRNDQISGAINFDDYKENKIWEERY